MEPGCLWGQNGWLNWSPPKYKDGEPSFSSWTNYELVYPRVHLVGKVIPVSLRCTACRIYWLGTDASHGP